LINDRDNLAEAWARWQDPKASLPASIPGQLPGEGVSCPSAASSAFEDSASPPSLFLGDLRPDDPGA
jgi:hypothetical protein